MTCPQISRSSETREHGLKFVFLTSKLKTAQLHTTSTFGATGIRVTIPAPRISHGCDG